MHKQVLDDSLIHKILSVAEEVPVGKVASYGQVARLVGKVPGQAELYANEHCHRAVSHAGQTAPGWAVQRLLVETAGVEFKADDRVDMKRFQWSTE